MGLFDKPIRILKHKKHGEFYQTQTKQTESYDIGRQTVFNLVKQLSLTDEEKEEKVLSLTTYERDIYLLLIEGFTLKEVAKQLSIKYSIAYTHMTQIYKKLKVNTRAELIINYRNIRG